MNRRWMLVLGAMAFLAAACSGDDDGGADSTTAEPRTGPLQVATAPALEDVIEATAEAFTDDGGSSVSVEPLEQSALVDAIDARTHDAAVLPDNWLGPITDQGEPTQIGQNRYVIVVPEDNPEDIAGLGAFAADRDLDTLACTPETPLGNVALGVFSNAGVDPDPAEVRFDCADEAVDGVADGSLDAALVFRANLDLPDGVEIVEVSDETNIVIRISILELDPRAEEFADFLQSDEAGEILAEFGYLP